MADDDATAREHRTVSRVTTILEAVAARAPLRMHEIATALAAPKSSVFGLVKGLVATGYLVEDEDGFRLGPALGNLLTRSGPDLAAAARPVLDELRDRFGETAMLGVVVGTSLIYVAAAESTLPIRYSAPLRVRRPLYPPSAGKVLLAQWSPRRRDGYLQSLALGTEGFERARAELDTVRRDGVAFNRGETLPDVSAVARPVLVGGAAVAAVAVAGPTGRITPQLEAIADVLADATAMLARRIGT